MQTKCCNRCNIIKSLDGFYLNQGRRRSICKDCDKAKKKEDYKKYREVIRSKQKTYYNNNRNKILEHKKDYYDANKDKIIKKFTIKYQTNPKFKLYTCIRRRTRDFLKNGTKYMDIIGCTHQQLLDWFEFNFELDCHWEMNWDNLGKIWQIDHVYALSLLSKLPEKEHSKYYTWQNLRPVEKNYNLRKSNKIKQMDLILMEIRVKMFNKKYNVNKVFIIDNTEYIDDLDDEYDELHCDIISPKEAIFNLSEIFE